MYNLDFDLNPKSKIRIRFYNLFELFYGKKLNFSGFWLVLVIILEINIFKLFEL